MEYVGDDLIAMEEAVAYHRWIMSMFRPFVGTCVLELGAGVGTFSRLFLDLPVEQLILVEPAKNLISALRGRFVADPRVEVVEGRLEQAVEAGLLPSVDTVVAVNVLEHIEDDRKILGLVASLLPPNGKLLLLVPALPAIFGTLDRTYGHFRRYSRAGLVDVVSSSGLGIRICKYVNMPGVLSWFLAGRVFRSATLTPRAVSVYDSLILPLVRAIETRIPPPIGQSLLLVGEKQ